MMYDGSIEKLYCLKNAKDLFKNCSLLTVYKFKNTL